MCDYDCTIPGYCLRVYAHRAAVAAAAAPLVVLLERVLLIYTVLHTPSSIQSSATSGKHPMGHRPIFRAATLVLHQVSFDLSWSIVMFFLLQMLSVVLFINKNAANCK